MSNGSFVKEYKKYCKIEKEYEKSYVPENINVGDNVHIMMPMLGNGQYGKVIQCREFPNTYWDEKKQDFIPDGTTRKAYVVEFPQGLKLQIYAEKLKKVC